MHQKPALLLLFACLPMLLRAQADSSLLPPVTVSATPIPSALPRVGRHLQLLDSASLHAAGTPCAEEVLRNRTLADVRQRGPFGAQTDLAIRGGSFDQALVLVDGIPMTDPQTGHHLMDLPVTMDAVDHVEVLYGGASRTYGAGAFSGAVNLVTLPPASDKGRFAVEAGSYGSYRARLLQDLRLGRTGLRIGGSYAHSDGYVPNSDLGMATGTAELYHPWGKYALRVQAGMALKAFGAQNFYTSAFPDQYEETGTKTVSAQLLHSDDSLNWSVQLYGRQHDDRFELFREDDGHYAFQDGYFIRDGGDTARFGPTFFYTYHNRHRTDAAGARARAERRWAAGTSAFAVHGRFEHIYSNVLGTPLQEPLAIAGERDPFTRADERRNLAFNLDHRFERGRWTLDGGLLLNVNSAFTPEWAPGLDAVYRWNDHHSSFASFGRAFRFPTWTDLYYNRGGAMGSKDLRPEHADQAEVGHRWARGSFSLKASVWYRQGHDLIDWVQLPGETTVNARNITGLNMAGGELELVRWHGRARYGLLYAYQDADRTEFPYRSLYVLDHLRHTAVLWAEAPIGASFRLIPTISWRQRTGTYIQYADGAVLPYPDPLRVDLRLEWTKDRFTLFAGVYNLLDEEQMDRGNVPLPGRWLSAGLQYRWGM